jgi:large subunit ribosomal protein L11
MAVKKEIVAKVKLQLPGGQATPAPPVGPALGQHGLNIMDFVKKFNDATKDKVGMVLPVEITIYKDRTYDFIIKTPPASFLIKKAIGIETGAHKPGHEIVGRITKKQIREIAKMKLADLNTNDIESAMKIIEGTAKNMGVQVVED